MDTTDNKRQFTGRDAQGRFAAGNTGRPKGAKGKASRETLEQVKAMKDGAIEKLWEAVTIGERWAIEFVLSKTLPSGRTVEFETLEPDDIRAALSGGDISIEESKTLSSTIRSLKELDDMDEIMSRLDQLEMIANEA